MDHFASWLTIMQARVFFSNLSAQASRLLPPSRPFPAGNYIQMARPRIDITYTRASDTVIFAHSESELARPIDHVLVFNKASVVTKFRNVFANTIFQPCRLFRWWNTTLFPRIGIHGATRVDLGDYWVYIYGQRRLCRGNSGQAVLHVHDLWLEMWITQTTYQTHEQGRKSKDRRSIEFELGELLLMAQAPGR